MSKPIKDMLTNYLRQRYEGVNSACVVDLTGLDVATTHKLRCELRDKNGRMEVVQNRLARRAFRDTPLAPLGETLTGPSALVVADALVDIAKALVSFAKENKALTLKDAILEGDPQLLSVAELSKMMSLAELLSEVASLISGPGRLIASAASSPQSKIAGCLKAIAEKE